MTVPADRASRAYCDIREKRITTKNLDNRAPADHSISAITERPIIPPGGRESTTIGDRVMSWQSEG